MKVWEASREFDVVNVLLRLTPTTFVFFFFFAALPVQVWIAAGTQVFYTFGIGVGSVVTLGSYNKFHQNFFRLETTPIFSSLGHSPLK